MNLCMAATYDPDPRGAGTHPRRAGTSKDVLEIVSRALD